MANVNSKYTEMYLLSKEEGMSSRQIAEVLDIGKSTVNDLLKGKSNKAMEFLLTLTGTPACLLSYYNKYFPDFCLTVKSDEDYDKERLMHNFVRWEKAQLTPDDVWGKVAVDSAMSSACQAMHGESKRIWKPLNLTEKQNGFLQEVEDSGFTIPNNRESAKAVVTELEHTLSINGVDIAIDAEAYDKFKVPSGVCGPVDVNVRPEDFVNSKERKFVSDMKSAGAWHRNVLCIGDLHEPFSKKGYLEFCQEMYKEYSCNHVIFMGDILDNHYASYHESDPDGMGGGEELDLAINGIQLWGKAFPEADVCIGNHDRNVLRKAFSSGVSKRWIRSFNEVLGVDWNFQTSHYYDGTLYRHGVGLTGTTNKLDEGVNIVQGHAHSVARITYKEGALKPTWGMQVPCGINRDAYSMAYASEAARPVIGAAVVLEDGNLPIIHLME